MNKALLFTIPVVVLLAISGLFLLNRNQQSKVSPTPIESTNSTSKIVTNDTEIPGGMPKPRYLEHNSTVLTENKDQSIVLFFFANWCPTCIPVDAELQKRSDEIPDGSVVIRVNYDDTETDDEEKALADKYGVTYQHTFVVIDESGNETKKWNGGGVDKILSEI